MRSGVYLQIILHTRLNWSAEVVKSIAEKISEGAALFRSLSRRHRVAPTDSLLICNPPRVTSSSEMRRVTEV